MTAEQVWRRKSDDELFAAARRLDEYTEEGRKVIQAELERRQSPDYVAEARAADRRAQQQRAQADSSEATTAARRMWLVVVVLGVPLLGFSVAKGIEATSGDADLSGLAQLAVGAGALGVGLIVVIAFAGVLARRSRLLLLLLFRPGLHLTAFVVTGLILVHAIILIESIYIGESALVHRVHLGIILAVGLGAISGVVAVARNAFSLVKKAETVVMGRAIARKEAPRLWETVENTAQRLGSLRPDHVVVGLDPNFFVTEADVVALGKRLTGRTLYCSLSLARILTTNEFVAVIGHELGHFRGDDTKFSERFYPIYRGTAASIMSLRVAGGRGWGRVSLLPAITVFGFFLEAFSAAERRFGRERELAADQAGASVAGAPVMAAALVKVHAYCGIWGDLHEAIVETLRAGRPVGNMSKRYADAVLERATSTAFDGITSTQLSHPTDSHPPLSTRLESLRIDLSSAVPAALLVTPTDAAVSLVPNIESTEEQISAAYQSLLAGLLAIDIKIVQDSTSRGGTPSLIRHCDRCGVRVLPTAEGLCPGCGVAI